MDYIYIGTPLILFCLWFTCTCKLRIKQFDNAERREWL